MPELHDYINAIAGEDYRAPEFYITTFTGLQCYLDRPTVDMITIEDIAHHLAMICRWSGACHHHFSIAQHSVCVSKIAPPHLKQWGLLHDAAEAYIGDITRPLKELLARKDPDAPSNIRMIEKNLMRVIANKFNLVWPEPDELKVYDDQMQKYESRILMHTTTRLHDRKCENAADIADLDPATQALPAIYTSAMLPEAAELMFLARYRKVFLDDDGM